MITIIVLPLGLIVGLILFGVFGKIALYILDSAFGEKPKPFIKEKKVYTDGWSQDEELRRVYEK